MDEPTNDLDVETLELLEEMLMDYPGTLLLVSHDRDFLDHVVTSTLAMEGDGRVGEYVGGYSDWLRQGGRIQSGFAERSPTPAVVATRPAPAAPPSSGAVAVPARRKLSYKETRELEQLPARIEALEAQLAELTALSSDPSFYQRDAGAITAHNATFAQVQTELDAAYARWAELEG
jgi:ATP-binding cassette subfamily F protein uup